MKLMLKLIKKKINEIIFLLLLYIFRNNIPIIILLFIPVIIGNFIYDGAIDKLFIKKKKIIKGFVLPGYETVLDLFNDIIDEGLEDKVQTSAFVDGILVVNLVGINNKFDEIDNKIYNEESIQNIFSSSKVISSIVIAMLVDKGYIKYETLISDIWPEFSSEDKHLITIKDLLKHESGLQKFSFKVSANELNRNNLKNKSISSKIANSKSTGKILLNKFTSDRRYGFLTRDIIINEVVMRADEKGRTIGEIMRDEICYPLEINDQLTMGNETIDYDDKLFPLVSTTSIWIIIQMFNLFNRKITLAAAFIQLFLLNSQYCYKIAEYLFGKKFSTPSIVIGEEFGFSDHLFVCDLFNHKLMKLAEIPSANMHSSSYALAKVASVMAGKGTQHGVQLISNNTYNESISDVTSKFDSSILGVTRFSQGGFHLFDKSFAFYRNSCFGWFGINGSAVQWHDELNIGFGYAGTLLNPELGAKNSSLIQNEIIKCCRKIKKNS
jgi:CubicO group peptidase (beta-lactamase class C family)